MLKKIAKAIFEPVCLIVGVALLSIGTVEVIAHNWSKVRPLLDMLP